MILHCLCLFWNVCCICFVINYLESDLVLPGRDDAGGGVLGAAGFFLPRTEDFLEPGLDTRSASSGGGVGGALGRFFFLLLLLSSEAFVGLCRSNASCNKLISNNGCPVMGFSVTGAREGFGGNLKFGSITPAYLI